MLRLCCYSGRVDEWPQRLDDLQNLKYILSGPSQEEIMDLRSKRKSCIIEKSPSFLTALVIVGENRETYTKGKKTSFGYLQNRDF